MKYSEMTLAQLHLEIQHIENLIWQRQGYMGPLELQILESCIDDVLDEIAKRNAGSKE